MDSDRDRLNDEVLELVAQMGEIEQRNSLFEEAAEDAASHRLQRIRDDEAEAKIKFAREDMELSQRVDEAASKLKTDRVSLTAAKDTYPDRASEAAYTNSRPSPFPTVEEFEEDLLPSLEDGAEAVKFKESPTVESFLSVLPGVASVAAMGACTVSVWAASGAISFGFGRIQVTSLPMAVFGVLLGIAVGLGLSYVVSGLWRRAGRARAQEQFIPLNDDPRNLQGRGAPASKSPGKGIKENKNEK